MADISLAFIFCVYHIVGCVLLPVLEAEKRCSFSQVTCFPECLEQLKRASLTTCEFMLCRWGINYSMSLVPGCKPSAADISSLPQSHMELESKMGTRRPLEKDKSLQRDEWLGLLQKIRNTAVVVLGIICLQLPFELVYAHLYEISESDAVK